MGKAKDLINKFVEDMQDDLKVVADQLVNNETDDDKSILSFLLKETSISKNILKTMIAKERKGFLGKDSLLPTKKLIDKLSRHL
jgi:hypothetical protein